MRISWLTRCLLTVPVVFARHIPRQASDETIINTAAPSTIVSTQPSATLTAGLSSTAGPVETPTNLPIKFYTLTLTKEYISPNGDWREAILINGQTPGPLLELEEGQEVSITVKNYCGEPATVHWHGIYQYETVWADGVAGVTQYPIDHGDQFVYNFTARQHGQYWGPLLIHPAKNRANPFSAIDSNVDQLLYAERNPKIVQLADWTRYTSEQSAAIFRQSGIDPLCRDSLLINGRGQTICPNLDLLAPFIPPVAGPLTDKACPLPNSTLSVGPRFNASSQFPDDVPVDSYQGCSNSSTPLTVIEVVQSEGWASFNFICEGGLLEQLVSIDAHSMIVYAADGEYVEPQVVDILQIGVGMRYSVMIKLDNPGDWTIRTANSQPNQFISAYAVLSYVDSYSSCYQPTDGLPGLCGNQVYTSPPSDQPKMGFAGNPIDGATTLDSFHLPPYPAVPPIIVADHTVIWDTSQPNDRLWKLDSQPFLAWRDDAQPAIIDPQPFLDADIAVSLNNGSVVDIVFSIPPGQPTHPFHKHETKFWVIGQGEGPWVWPDVDTASKAVPDSFNFYNPSLRDTARSLASFGGPTWIVIRYQVLYPSFTFFHCHISIHLQVGMAALLVEGLDVGYPFVPDQIRQGGDRIVLTENPDPVFPNGDRVSV